jgi:hypothetical protein
MTGDCLTFKIIRATNSDYKRNLQLFFSSVIIIVNNYYKVGELTITDENIDSLSANANSKN